MVLGWDSEPPLRPLAYLLQSLSAWKWNAYLGQPNIFQITQAPLAVVYLALSRLLGVALAEKSLLTILFVLPAFTAYYAARRIFPNDRFLPFAAGWCFALCPLLFVRYYVPIVTVQLAYALLPLAVNAWVNLMRGGARPRSLLWIAGVELAFLPCANNLAYWVVPHVTAIAFAGLLHLTRSHRPHRARAFWLGIAVLVAINAFWLVPQVLFGLVAGSTFEHEAINHAYTVGVKKDVAHDAGLSYTLRMSTSAQTGAGDRYGPYVTYARALQNGLIAAPYFLWMLLAAAALALRPRDRRVVVLGALLAFALYVMKGESAPLAFGLAWFYRIPLLGTIFRDGYDKLLPMAAFAFAMLLPVAAEAIGRLTRRPRALRWALVAIVLAMAFPYWTGQMFMARPSGPNLASMPPASAFAFGRLLDRVHSRILFAPISDNPQLLATDWHFFGPNVYGSMTDADVISMAASIMNTPGSDRIMTALHAAIDSGDVATFEQDVRAAGVGYVFVAHDMNSEYYGGETAAKVDAFLREVPGTRQVARRGPYVLWKLPGVRRVDRHLRRLPIATYDTSFTAARALVSRCGKGRFALIPLTQGSCTIALSPVAPSSQLPVTPARVRVGRNHVRISRATVTGRAVETRALPAGITVVGISGRIVGSTARYLTLVPCKRYRVDSYAVTTYAAPIDPAALVGVDGAALVPLPAMSSGLNVVKIATARSGVGAGVAIVDAVTRERVAAREHLAYPSTLLALDALPGRSYALLIGSAENFGVARSYLRNLRIAHAQLRTPFVLRAPRAGAQPCAVEPSPAAFAIAADVARVGAVVSRGALVLHPYAGRPMTSIAVPLPAGTTLAAIGGNVVGRRARDVGVPTGARVRVDTYAAVGSTRRIPIDAVTTSSNLSAVNLDRAAGTVAMRADGPDQWMRFVAPLTCPHRCRLDLRLGTLIGRVGLAAVDQTDGSTLTARLKVRSQGLSLLLPHLADQPIGLYVHSMPLPSPTPLPGATAAPASPSDLQIAAMTLTPLRRTGAAWVAVPRVRSALPTERGAITVSALAVRPPPLRGRTLRPSSQPSAVVLDTQFDPFWTTLIFPSSGGVYFPQHVVANAYQNAWIVPAAMQGTVITFYLSNVLAASGLLVALIALAVLARASLRRNS